MSRIAVMTAGVLCRRIWLASSLKVQSVVQWTDLACVREQQSVDGDDIDLTHFFASVSAVGGAVKDWHLFPGQLPQLSCQCRLVVLVGVVDLFQQRGELGDLVGLGADLAQGGGERVVVSYGREDETRLPSGRLAPRRHLPSTA